jgi:hypothetical protein
MKTEEDEAFDDLARKQGMWGGGFQAKRQAAMDKINSEFHEEYIKYRTAFPKGYIDPQQEPVGQVGAIGSDGFVGHIYDDRKVKTGDKLYTTPPQREWVGLTDDERNKILMSDKPSWERHIAEEIEAKLKDKNG